ncbi:tetratricopeptide repeat-containing sensor histidine kinase [Flavobacterium hydrocarbonoxydans]|nr:tetratricopeptide repeat-containing sensor histidine kinase [Flavobacterium hydrocarbonoxydans]
MTKEELAKQAEEAIIDGNKGLYEKSLVKSRILLNNAIANKDDYYTAKAYNNIASVFFEMNDIDNALLFFEKALSFAQKTNRNDIKNSIHNNLGNLYYFNKGAYKKGISHYLKSISYIDKKDTHEIALTKINIIWAYFASGEYDQGFPYLSYVNQYYKPEKKDKTNTIVVYTLNGMYYTHNKDFEKAEDYFKKAIELGIKEDEKLDLRFAYQEYIQFFCQTDNYKKAYETLRLYNNVVDQLNQIEKEKTVNLAGMNLHVDEYKRQIDKIGTEYKMKQQLLEMEQSRNKRVVSLMLLIFIIVFILLYFYYQNNKLKQENKLNDIQRKIQLNMINASIDGQESERKKIATFLHDNISAMLSSAGLHLNAFLKHNEIQSEEIIKTKEILKTAHDKVRDLSHELLPTLLVRFGLLYAIEDLCEKNSNSLIHFEFSSNIPIKKRYTEKFEIRIYFILSELFNNIIKHSQADKAIIILNETDGKLNISIRDNGKGFDTSKFNITEGFGLNRIRARIKKLKGTFSIKSKPDEGTVTKIKIPFPNK